MERADEVMRLIFFSCVFFFLSTFHHLIGIRSCVDFLKVLSCSVYRNLLLRCLCMYVCVSVCTSPFECRAEKEKEKEKQANYLPNMWYILVHWMAFDVFYLWPNGLYAWIVWHCYCHFASALLLGIVTVYSVYMVNIQNTRTKSSPIANGCDMQ